MIRNQEFAIDPVEGGKFLNNMKILIKVFFNENKKPRGQINFNVENVK